MIRPIHSSACHPGQTFGRLSLLRFKSTGFRAAPVLGSASCRVCVLSVAIGTGRAIAATILVFALPEFRRRHELNRGRNWRRSEPSTVPGPIAVDFTELMKMSGNMPALLPTRISGAYVAILSHPATVYFARRA